MKTGIIAGYACRFGMKVPDRPLFIAENCRVSDAVLNDPDIALKISHKNEVIATVGDGSLTLERTAKGIVWQLAVDDDNKKHRRLKSFVKLGLYPGCSIAANFKGEKVAKLFIARRISVIKDVGPTRNPANDQTAVVYREFNFSDPKPKSRKPSAKRRVAMSSTRRRHAGRQRMLRNQHAMEQCTAMHNASRVAQKLAESGIPFNRGMTPLSSSVLYERRGNEWVYVGRSQGGN